MHHNCLTSVHAQYACKQYERSPILTSLLHEDVEILKARALLCSRVFTVWKEKRTQARVMD
jgi:hypothetical protein